MNTKQVQDVQSLISRGVDVLVIVPHDGKAMGQAVDEAALNKIPVLSYDRLITNTKKPRPLYFLRQCEGGGGAGGIPRDTLLKTKPKIGIVRIYGSPTDNNAKLFKTRAG